MDTFAYDLKSAPSFYNMGDGSYSDFELNMSDRYIYFEENIYTGYHWYETAAADGVVITSGGTTWDYSDYDSIVQYPFGYGLSYTSFDWELVDHQVDGKGGNITCTVKVTNTGSTAGKDVVQLYYAAPYTPGGIEKSAVNLGAFAKTGLLQPGESQTVELSMVFDDMASFDYAGQGCYVMDAGEYAFTLQTDSHNLKSDGLSFTYRQSDTIIYNGANDGARSTDLIPAVTQQEFIDGGSLETNVNYLSRADFAGTFPQVERRLNPTSIPSEVKARLEANGPGSDILERDDDSVPTPIVGAAYAQEALAWDISGLYAPAMNTHRSPFGARSFELAVKYGKCTGMMTELSRIGTSWSSATYALCTTMPRGECGFQGKIITDGVGPGGSYYMLPGYALRAGTDMMLTMASGDCGFTSATLDSDYGVTCMQNAAKNILYVYANSAAIDTAVSSEAGWSWMWAAGNILLIALMIAVFALLPFRAWCLGGGKQGTVNCVWLVASIVSGVVGVIGLVVAVLAVANVQILSWSIGYILTSGTNDTVLMPSVIAAVASVAVFIVCMVFGKRIHATAEKE